MYNDYSSDRRIAKSAAELHDDIFTDENNLVSVYVTRFI